MKIGNIEIKGRTVLAPLAGITDLPFRLICKGYGAGLVYTEMISAEGLIRKQGGTVSITETTATESPVSFQLFGAKPASMAEAARMLCGMGAELIDINMGCPVKKVVRGGSGSALLKDLRLAGEIIDAVVKASSAPVTIKVRTGWDAKDTVAPELAKAAEGAGAAAVCVHGRTAKQGFSGVADWSVIRMVKEAVGVPVIGNGDVHTAKDAERMIDETGCDLVMIGRGSLGAPWVFREVEGYLSTGDIPPHPDAGEREEVLLRHLREVVRRGGEDVGVKSMRKHGAWYVKGMEGAAEFRRLINSAETLAEFEGAVKGFFRRT